MKQSTIPVLQSLFLLKHIHVLAQLKAFQPIECTITQSTIISKI